MIDVIAADLSRPVYIETGNIPHLNKIENGTIVSYFDDDGELIYEVDKLLDNDSAFYAIRDGKGRALRWV